MLKGLIDLVFPNPCLSCGRKLGSSEHFICTSCKMDLPYAKEYLNPEDADIQKLFWGKVELAGSYTGFYFQKANVVQRIVHQLKYKNQPLLGKEMGIWLGNEIVKYEKPLPDIIVPVPLHYKREKQRGYNQSYYLALGVGEVLDRPVKKGLIRRQSHNTSQTKQSRFSRYDNVSSIFKVLKKPKAHHKHLLLVDDVVTTGATLEALSKTIIEETGCDVSIATFAITKN